MFLRAFRADALRRQGRACHYCREPLTLAQATADHATSRKAGGATRRENIRAACFSCNQTKGDMGEQLFLRIIKNPRPGDGVHVWLAHFRRRLWMRTERACRRIEESVAIETGG